MLDIDDIIFRYDKYPAYTDRGKLYRVELKSRKLMEEDGIGTLFWVTVFDDRTVYQYVAN